MTAPREAIQLAITMLKTGSPECDAGDVLEVLEAALAESEPFQPDWDRIEPLQENLREHMAEIQRLRAKLAEPCPCGDRSAAECPGEWEPGCDLGNNPKYAKRVNLAEPVQAPVAWRWRMRNLTDAPGFVQPWTVTTYYPREQANEIEPLFIAPPQRPAQPVQEPVLNPAPGYCKHCKQYTIEEPLPAEPVQEPVAWLSTDCIGERYLGFSKPLDNDPVQPLYTAPPQGKPLTREQAIALWADKSDGPSNGEIVSYCRAVERAHGITS